MKYWIPKSKKRPQEKKKSEPHTIFAILYDVKYRGLDFDIANYEIKKLVIKQYLAECI